MGAGRMTRPRTLDAVAYARINTATIALIRAVGGLEAAATVCRSPVTRLSDFQNPHKPDAMPADVVADLEHVAGSPIVTTVLATLANHALIPLEAFGEGSDAAAIAEVGRDASLVFAEYARAMADQKLDATERAALADRLAALHRASGAALALLRRAGEP